MPLDLKKVVLQINALSKPDSNNITENRLKSTFNVFKSTCDNYEPLLKKLLETKSSQKAKFFFAIPEYKIYDNLSLKDIITPNEGFSLPHIVAATDGSQINPSSHEFTSAFLINIGQVCIPYFKSEVPVQLTSIPSLYNSLEEISSFSLQEEAQGEDLISYERTLKEIEELLSLVKSYKKYNLPIVALLDGTLIHWHLEKFSNSFIEHFISRFSKYMNEFKLLNIPVASILSNSRSNDLINMLKIFKCPYEKVDCKKYCSNIDSKDFPCNPCLNYKPIFDRRLIDNYFNEKNTSIGSRTILFESNNKILNYYPEDLKVYFFYINTGTEIARIELPKFVIEDKNMLELLHNVVTIQCKVGFGYPIVLSEAHLQAVVNRSDREVFYNLIKEHLLKTKQSKVQISSKELRKRISFV